LKIIKLMKNEVILWKGRDSIWGSNASFLLIFGSFLIIAGIAMLFKAWILSIIGLILVLIGYFSTKRFSNYIITNMRIIELKSNRVINEVKFKDIIGASRNDIEKFIEGFLDFLSTIIGTSAIGLIPRILGLGSLKIRDKSGKVIFTFKRVKVNLIRNKLREAFERYASIIHS